MSLRRLLGLMLAIMLPGSAASQDVRASASTGSSCKERLSRMSVAPVAIGRSNAIPFILQSYRPDPAVRGILFLPSVADQFYLIERGQGLQIAGSNLWEVIESLTNQTSVRATLVDPFLVFHTERDQLTPHIKIDHRGAAVQLQQSSRWTNLLLVDQHWDRVQPELSRRWERKVTPAKNSEDAWHFGRHNVVGAYLTDWQVLQALVLTGHTTVTIHRKTLAFSE